MRQVRSKTFYVVKNIRNALLGRPAIDHLGIVVRVERLMKDIKDITKSYPKLFNGLVLFLSLYQIRVKEDAKSYALSTPRRIAIRLLLKVREELFRTKSMDVTERVMVVVPKANGRFIFAYT